MSKNYSAVFIDWDDTLWDFHANAYIAMEKAYEKYGLQRYFHSFQHFYNLYGYIVRKGIGKRGKYI